MGTSDRGGRIAGLQYLGVGFSFIAEVTIVAALGYWGDRKLGTDPWLLVLGVLAGSGLATVSLVRNLQRIESRSTGSGPNASEDGGER